MTYSYRITNTGDVMPLTDVTAKEQEQAFTGTGTPPVVSCPPAAASLAPTAHVTCTATYRVTQADMDAGSVSNTAVASGTDPAEDTVTSAPSTAILTTTANPALTVVKSGTSSGGAALHVGDVVTYSFVVTNTGNVTLTDVAVDEGTFTGTGALSAVTCPGGAPSLTPGDQVTCTATYVVTAADVDAASLTQHRDRQSAPHPVRCQDRSPHPRRRWCCPAYAAQPALALVKTASPHPSTRPWVRRSPTRSEITNSGNVPVTEVAVTDTEFTGSGSLSAVSCPAGANLLVPGAAVTCTATYRAAVQADLDAGSVTNSATASGKDPSGAPVTSPQATARIVSKTGPTADPGHLYAPAAAPSFRSPASPWRVPLKTADVALVLGAALMFIAVVRRRPE